MDYFANVRTLEDKLAATLDNNGLLHNMNRNKYPITVTITQNKAPDAQLEMFAATDGGISSRDSVLRFIFKLEGLEIQTSDRLVISDALMNKVKNQVKKVHAAYVHAYFAATANTGLAANLYDEAPEDEDDGPEQETDEFDESFPDSPPEDESDEE